jgi:hypothetical protein
MSGRTDSQSNGPEGAVTAANIIRAEGEVGAALARELADWFTLVPELTDFMGRLVASVDLAPGEPGAVHALATLLARVTTELQAATHLVRLGYPLQALSITGTMLELMHTAGYIGDSAARAAEWFAHDDPTRSYPPSLKKAITAVAAKIGAPPEALTREYEVIYRQICMAKHGNPLAFGETTLLSDEDSVYLIVGPHHSERMLRLASVALQYSTRYAMLTCLAFLTSHLHGESAVPYLDDLHRIEATYTTLGRAATARFAPKA